MKNIKVSLLFAWYDLWVGLFYDKKKQWLYILPIPMFGIILKFNLFRNWMDELQEIAITTMPQFYKKGDKWYDTYWRETYYSKGFTPQEAWNDYTKMVK